MSHKGYWHRIGSFKTFQDNHDDIFRKKQPTRLIDILGTYPDEMLTYEAGFDIEQYDLPMETHFKSIREIQLETIESDLDILTDTTNPPRIFLITNHKDETCKVAVWMGNE